MTKELTAETARKRRKTKILVVATIIVVAAVFGTNQFLQRRLESSSKSVTQNGASFPVQNAAAVAAVQDVRVAQAQLVRSKWRAWASNHAPLLKRMRQTNPQDKEAFLEVWKALPTDPYEIKEGSLGEDLISGVEHFSWQPSAKAPVRAANPLDKSEYELDNQRISKEAQREFTEHRDIIVAKAEGVGPHGVALWASGRVTRSEMVPQTIAIVGEPAFKTVHEEVSPSFDFLS